MLRDGEGWNFTLRELARRAGVSHTAPYKHFADKSALLAEIAAQGYRRLREEVVIAISAPRLSPQSEIVEAARAYMRFARANGALYRLMFSADVDKTRHIELNAASAAMLQVLLDILERGHAANQFRAARLRDQAAACWGLVHGLTMLELDHQLTPEKVGSSPTDAAIAVLLEGLAA